MPGLLFEEIWYVLTIVFMQECGINRFYMYCVISLFITICMVVIGNV